MKHLSATFIFASLLVFVPFMVGQQDQSEPSPIPSSEDLASSDLVAWSGMQSPQPVSPSGQQPLGPDPQAETTPPRNPTPAPESAPAKPATPSQNSDQNRAPSARTFLGTISKQGDAYLLKTESSSYQLDAQDKAKQFDGQKVRVIGILDPSGNSIQVQSIDPVS